MALLPMQGDVALNRKCNMAAAKPEVLISQAAGQIEEKFQRLSQLFGAGHFNGTNVNTARRRPTPEKQYGRRQTRSIVHCIL
jgi:hypothetical protein